MLAVETAALALLALVLVLVLVAGLRGLLVLRAGPRQRPGAKGSVSVLVVAGSGGHTAEILRLLGALSAAYSPRYYVVAQTDRMSEDKIQAFESSRPHSADQFRVFRVPRSREVHQSWSSTVVSTFSALCSAVPLVFRLQPDVVLCNGPGSCLPVALGGLLLGLLGVKRVVLVFVESLCRVESLSLTGRLLYPVTDYFFVQWAGLRDRYPHAIFLGRLV